MIAPCLNPNGEPCSNVASFALRRIHDGGGKRYACVEHLADVVTDVAASLPEWASSPKNHGVLVEEMS